MSDARMLAAVAGISAIAVVLGLGLTLAGSHRRRRMGPMPVAATAPARRHPALEDLAGRLERAGVPFGPTVLILAVVVGAMGAAAVVALVLGLPILAPAAALGVVAAAASVVGNLERRHTQRVAAQLPTVGRQLAVALGAGLSLRQALHRAGRDAPDPAGAELRLLSAELAMGARVEAALDGWLARQPGRDLRVLLTAIAVQRATGGDLARALAQIADRLEERTRLAREISGATAQARMTAWLVAALPLGGGVLAELVAPGTLARTVGSGVGLALLLVSSGLYAVGVAVVRRIGRVEV